MDQKKLDDMMDDAAYLLKNEAWRQRLAYSWVWGILVLGSIGFTFWLLTH